jgi:hypothetical protein
LLGSALAGSARPWSAKPKTDKPRSSGGGFWNSTAASWENLHPVTYNYSTALSVWK